MRAKNESQNEKADVKSFPKLVKAPKLTIRKYLKNYTIQNIEVPSLDAKPLPRCPLICEHKMFSLMPWRHAGRPGNKRDIDLP